MRFWTLAIILILPLSLFAQKKKNKKTKAPKEDLEAAELIFQGKTALQEGDYDWAMVKFKRALLRPEHQATSAAIYLLGLSHYFKGESFEAHMQFDSLIHNFPQSRYVGDSKYHKALLFMDREDDYLKVQAMKLFQWVADSARDKALRDDAKFKMREFAFSTNEYFLERYLESYDSVNKILFLEALCFQYLNRGDRDTAKEIYRKWLRNGGKRSDYLARQFDRRRQKRRRDRNEFKIAVFLPLHLQEEMYRDSLIEIPAKSKLALEFYEGLQMAVDEAENRSKDFVFRIFDSAKDSQVVEDLLYELNNFYPDLVLGSIFNTQSEIISRWAERTGTPQIVPLSPSANLIDDKQFTFLATPEVQVHGRVMAEYARDSLGLEKVVVWTNQTKSTDLMAQAFTETFQQLGGVVISIPIDPDYEVAKDEIPDLVRALKFQEADGVYIPILGAEESVGLIMSKLRALELPIKVMGGPHMWKRYNTIDESLKQALGLTFTSSFYTQNEDVKYRNFYQDYLQKYYLPPGEYSVQGFDLGKYLMHVLDNYYPPAMSLDAYLRNHPPYRGLHISYDFRSGQSNAYLNIGAYLDGRVVKVNDTEVLSFESLEDR
ncbi:MAG: ABC transporter substrate-binding protein [Bacteroidota bacterium]